MHSAAALAMSLLLSQMLLLLAVASAVPDDRCQRKCGDVDIPYPFGIGAIGTNCSWDRESVDYICSRTETGIGANCFLGRDFNLTCYTMESGLIKPFYGNLEFLNISLDMGQVRMLNDISSACYNRDYNNVTYSRWGLNLGGSYRFSDLNNKFTVIGCETLAYIVDDHGNNSYQSGCVSMCRDEQSIVNDSCSGMGCCQTSIPKNLQYYRVWFDRGFDNSDTWRFSNCSYAVLLEAESFQFHTSYITTNQLMQINGDGRVPVVLDWVIGNETCEVAKRNQTSYACISNYSVCVNSSNGPGYLCNCSKGYQGNPYVSNGCQDINECNLQPNPCSDGICRNLPGSYTCDCRAGTHGNAYNGTCIPDQKLPLAVKVAIGACSGVIILLLCLMCLYIVYQRRKLEEMKRKYFKQYGGHELEERMKLGRGLNKFKIFGSKELEKATNHFDDKNIIGRGGNGVVYKGVLENQDVVAIKKPKIINEDLKKQFGTETLILSDVNHVNIVKLLGCCLEMEMPLLVYEFVQNGTLFHLIHENENRATIFLDTRLRIAYESADALDYLHSKVSPQIIHGDVKSSNILLDVDNTAKISDFGASKLIPKGEEQFATLLQFTHGYIDPECLVTYELTHKSDVYSFGVVLLELFTGKKAINFEESEEQRSLASTFTMLENQNRVSEIFDNQVKLEANIEFIQELTRLIKQCLKLKGEDRPTMREVAEELNGLRTLNQHPFVAQHNAEEMESLLSGLPNDNHADFNTTFEIESRLTGRSNIQDWL
ncbi:wall-associated receptor kinase 3-like [Curcuma longa]|uniref:wall-associated receptor kinase 3-like n=1 Tax=Curcuma longa TaxID=136217 RepID=UPI003D9E311C